jgi:hypothetical protein
MNKICFIEPFSSLQLKKVEMGKIFSLPKNLNKTDFSSFVEKTFLFLPLFYLPFSIKTLQKRRKKVERQKLLTLMEQSPPHYPSQLSLFLSLSLFHFVTHTTEQLSLYF